MKHIDEIKSLIIESKGLGWHESAYSVCKDMANYSLMEIADSWIKLEQDYALLIEVAKDWLRMKEKEGKTEC